MKKALVINMESMVVDFYEAVDINSKMYDSNMEWIKDIKFDHDIDIKLLQGMLKEYKNFGYDIIFASYGLYGATAQDNKRVKAIKEAFLNYYNIPFDEVYVIKYNANINKYLKYNHFVSIDDGYSEFHKKLISSKTIGRKFIPCSWCETLTEKLANILGNITISEIIE